MDNQAKDNRDESIQKLGEMIKDIKTAMLTTQEADGCLRSRPMGTQQVEFDGDLWFFTGKESGKVASIQKDQHVNVSYTSPKDNRFVSVTGNAELVLDRAKFEELWDPSLNIWFPQGLEDPNLALLKVTVESAEYWDYNKSKMVAMLGFAKSLITGEQKKSSRDEHDRISIRH